MELTRCGTGGRVIARTSLQEVFGVNHERERVTTRPTTRRSSINDDEIIDWQLLRPKKEGAFHWPLEDFFFPKLLFHHSTVVFFFNQKLLT